MPFQSEKQRRYLWANEPEIARDWTDEYGSGIAKALGGRIGFAKGSQPYKLKQRFIEVIRLMNQAEGDELVALALEAQTLKEQIAALEQIEPSVGQGIQSLQREEPQRTSIFPKEFTTAPQDDEGYQIYKEGYGKEQIFPGLRTPPISEHQIGFTKQKPTYRAMKGRMDRSDTERLEEMFKRHRPSRANGGRIPFQEGGYEWSSENNPELLQKMNDAVDKAVNDYLRKIKTGEISFPDNLQLEIDKVGNKTRHDMIRSQSDQPEIFSETLQEGLDTSNIKQKQKRSREQELLDEMNQTKGTIKFDPNNVEIMKAGLIPDNFIEQIKSLWGGEPEAPTGIMKAGGYPFMDPADANYIPRETMANWGELDDLEAQQADAQRQMQLARLANMQQYPPTEEDESGNWLARFKQYAMPAYNFARGNIGAGLMGLVQNMNPMAALAMFTGGKNLKDSRFYKPATGGAGGYTAAQLNQMNALGGYYSDPARQQRRTQSRIQNMLARKAAGKSYSQKNLNTLTMNQGPAGITPKAPRGPVGPPPGGGPHGNGGGGGGGGIGSTASQRGPAGGSVGASRFRSRGGRLYNTGGLAGLWPR